MSQIKAQSDVSSETRSLNFGLSLHQYSYIRASNAQAGLRICADSPES